MSSSTNDIEVKRSINNKDSVDGGDGDENNNNNNNNNDNNDNNNIKGLFQEYDSGEGREREISMNQHCNSGVVNNHVQTLSYHKASILCLETCCVYRHVTRKNKEEEKEQQEQEEQQQEGEETNKAIERKRYVFTGSQDCKIGVWDVSSFQLIGTLMGHSRTILKLRALPRRHPLLFSSARDNCICIWDIDSLSLLIRLSGFNSCVYDMAILAFPKHGGYFLYGACQDTSIFELEVEKIVDTLPYVEKKNGSKVLEEQNYCKKIEETQHTDLSNRHSISFSHSPNLIAPQLHHINNTDIFNHNTLVNSDNEPPLPMQENTMRIFDHKTRFLNKLISSLENKVLQKYERCHAGLIYVLKASAPHYLVSGSADASIKIWKVKPKQKLICLATLEGHTHSVVALDSIAQKYLISASKDNLLKVWNVSVPSIGHTAWTMSGHMEEITAMKVLASEKLIVSGSRDGMVRFWNTQNYECIHSVMLSQTPENIEEQQPRVQILNQTKEECDLHVLCSGSHDHSKDEEEESEMSSDDTNTTPVENKSCDLTNNQCSNIIDERHYINPDTTMWSDSLLCNHDGISSCSTTNIPIYPMDFLFVPPFWLMIADTSNQVKVWDISNILINTTLPKIPSTSLRLNEFSASAFSLICSAKTPNLEEIFNELSLIEYLPIFQKERIDTEVLCLLTNEELKKLGLPMGPRKKLMNFISAYIMQKQLHKTHINEEDNIDVTETLILSVHDPTQNLFRDLSKFVGLRSVSSDPSCKDQSWKAARFFQERCEQFGAKTRLVQGLPEKNPVVLARFSPNTKENQPAIRVLVYGHYDVAPVSNQEQWMTSPFQLTGKNGYLYGRGAADNKGPLIVYAYALKEYLEEYVDMINNSSPVCSSSKQIIKEPQNTNKIDEKSQYNHDDGNKAKTANHTESLKDSIVSWEVIIICEGQGTSNWRDGGLQQAIEKNLDWVDKPALILSSTSSWLGDDVPCLVYGTRGLVSLKCEVFGPKADMHSGVHGGAFNEPALDLIQVLAKLKNPNIGEDVVCNDLTKKMINIPHFYDYIDSITNNTKSKITENMNEVSELSMSRMKSPSLSVHTIQMSNSQETIISKQASAIISIHTIPGQKNNEIFKWTEKFLTQQFKTLKSGNQLKVKLIDISDSWLMDRHALYFKVAEEAILEHWNMKPYYIREDTTTPCTNYLLSQLHAPCLQMPLAQENNHSNLSNECIRLNNLIKGKEVIKTFFRKFFSSF